MVSGVAFDHDSLLDRLGEIASLSFDARSTRDLEVLDELRVLLVRLDFVTSLDRGNSVLSEKSVGTVRVVVDTSVESGGGIGTETRLNEASSSGVFLDEGRNVVNESSDDHEFAGLASIADCGAGKLESGRRIDEECLAAEKLTFIPSNYGQVVAGLGPFDLGSGTGDSLELHSDLTALDGRVGEGLKLTSESELVASEDEPLRRVVCVR